MEPLTALLKRARYGEMSDNGRVERGFKSRCEEMARSLRIVLGIAATDQLAPERLASYRNVLILSLYDIGLSDEDLRQSVEVMDDGVLNRRLDATERLLDLADAVRCEARERRSDDV